MLLSGIQSQLALLQTMRSILSPLSLLTTIVVSLSVDASNLQSRGFISGPWTLIQKGYNITPKNTPYP
jgi:hypothetical protein